MSTSSSLPVRVGALGLIALPVLVIIGVVVAAAVSLSFNRIAPTPNPATPTHPSPPRLEVATGGDLAATRRQADQRLTGYGWVDRDKGVARIPLDRAMAITAQTGWRDPEPGQ
jgi:hypothetical protein